MKTTLWTQDEAERARSLIAAVESDLREALDAMDAAVVREAEYRKTFERARPKEASPAWIDLVRANDDVDAALETVAELVREVGRLNGRIDYDRGGKLSLAGEDEDGRLVYWKHDDGDLTAETVVELPFGMASVA